MEVFERVQIEWQDCTCEDGDLDLSFKITLKINLAVAGVRYVSVVIQEHGRNNSAHLRCHGCLTWPGMSREVSLGEARSAKLQLLLLENRTDWSYFM
jgi:hypothetical protein